MSSSAAAPTVKMGTTYSTNRSSLWGSSEYSATKQRETTRNLRTAGTAKSASGNNNMLTSRARGSADEKYQCQGMTCEEGGGGNKGDNKNETAR